MEFNRIKAFILILAISAINCAIFNMYSNFDGSKSPPSSSLQDDPDLRYFQPSSFNNNNEGESPAASTEYNPLVIPSPSSSTDREPIQQPASAYISVGRLRELERMMMREQKLCSCITQCLRRKRGSLELPSQKI